MFFPYTERDSHAPCPSAPVSGLDSCRPLRCATGAGLFLRGLERFINLDPGWRVDGLPTAQTGMPKNAAFYRQLEERLRTLPGVKEVALSTSQPFWGFQSSSGARAEGQPEPPPGKWPEVFFEPVSTKYFETLGVPLLQGRAFTAALWKGCYVKKRNPGAFTIIDVSH